MTKSEFNRLMEEHDFYYALGKLAEENGNLYSFDEIKEMMKNAMNTDWSLVRRLANAIKYTDVQYYYYNEHDPDFNLITPVDDMQAIEDYKLLEEDEEETNVEEELTLEKVKQWIYDNATHVDDLFEDDEIYDYVRMNRSVEDIFDEDDIIDWVKDNCYVGDLVEIGNIDWEWK